MKNNFFRKHLVISTMISIVVCFVISVMIGQVIGQIIFPSMDKQVIADKYILDAFGKLFGIIITLLLICLSGLLKNIKIESGKFKEVGILFVFIIVISLYNVIGNGIANRGISYTEFHPNVLLACALYALATGVLEELICRVLLFQNMYLKWKGKKNSALKAVLISSIIFGLCHLMNLPAGLTVTLFQVYYAVIIGIVFAAMYYIGRNIWICIISHFLIDFCGIIGYAFMPNDNAIALSNDLASIDISAIIIVAFMTIGAIYAVITILKKS